MGLTLMESPQWQNVILERHEFIQKNKDCITTTLEAFVIKVTLIQLNDLSSLTFWGQRFSKIGQYSTLVGFQKDFPCTTAWNFEFLSGERYTI